MAGENTVSTLNGLFKEIYADKLKHLIPEGVKLMKKIPFSPRKKEIGNQYHQPVVLGLEHGITYASDSDGAFALDAAVNGVIKDAVVVGSQMMLRSQLGIGAASRAQGGEPRAFEGATKFLVRNMLKSMAKRVEVGLLYGQVGIATVDSLAGQVITIKTSEWAPGIFAGSENMKIDVYQADLATIRQADLQISSVDMDARTITVVGTVTGIADTDVVFYKSANDAGTFKEAAGAHKILTNTGTLFGISASTYTLWKGNEVDLSSAALSFAALQDAIARGVEKGLDEAVSVFVNPRAWADLLTEQTALRQYDSSYSVGSSENGSQEITFYGQNGKVEIVPSIHVKEGYAYCLCLADMMRIGSSDITFDRPDQDGRFFRELTDAAGYELRAYSDQALFCAAPGKNTLIKGITN